MLAPGLQILTDFCGSITTLVGFNERRANVSIAVLGNPETVVFTARGVLPDIHADPGHQFSWVGKSFDITNLRYPSSMVALGSAKDGVSISSMLLHIEYRLCMLNRRFSLK